MDKSQTVEVDKQHVFVCGLPRSGSTLLCQLLAHHPGIYCNGTSSPLANIIVGMRERWSNDAFLLSQLEVDFDTNYQRLLNAYRGLVNGWFADTDKTVVVDKNRAWLGAIDAASLIDVNCKFIVCIRELGQIAGSIEAQHQKTVLLDSGEGTANLTPFGRVRAYFSNGGLVCNCLATIEAVLEDFPHDLLQRVYFLKFEDLLSSTDKTMADLAQFIGVEQFSIDSNKLNVSTNEADSHYRFKFSHTTRPKIEAASIHRLAERTEQSLQSEFAWFFEAFYPALLQPGSGSAA